MTVPLQRNPDGTFSEPGVPFDYDALDRHPGTPQQGHPADASAEQVTHRLLAFLRDHVITKKQGERRDARAIAARLLVFYYLLDPACSPSMAAERSRIGCSRAWLSKIAVEFSAALGLRAIRTNGDRSHLRGCDLRAPGRGVVPISGRPGSTRGVSARSLPKTP